MTSKGSVEKSAALKNSGNTTVVLLRVAAVLMFIHFAGHTMGMWQGPSHGAAEIAVIDTMKAHRFNTMGSLRSYWDFFLGFGYDASLNMLFQAVLLLLLAAMAERYRAEVRPIVALLTVVWIASFLLYLNYFFVAATAFAALMVGVLTAAWLTARAPSETATGGPIDGAT